MTPVTNRADIPLIPTPRLLRADGSIAVLAAIGCIGEGRPRRPATHRAACCG